MPEFDDVFEDNYIDEEDELEEEVDEDDEDEEGYFDEVNPLAEYDEDE